MKDRSCGTLPRPTTPNNITRSIVFYDFLFIRTTVMVELQGNKLTADSTHEILKTCATSSSRRIPTTVVNTKVL